MVHWLLQEAGAKPNPLDRFGRTPLEDAVSACNQLNIPRKPYWAHGCDREYACLPFVDQGDRVAL